MIRICYSPCVLAVGDRSVDERKAICSFIPRTWKRFYRGDKSRSARGLRLRLALLKAIAQAHGGQAEVERQPGSGAAFRLILPAPHATARQ